VEKVLVCGTNFHARQIVRRLRKKNDVLVIGIVDFTTAHSVKTFMGFDIYDYSEVGDLVFDKLVVAGRYVPEVVNRLLKLEINPERIVELTRKDFAFNEEETFERSKRIWEMLDIFLNFCKKQELKYHLAAGSVLAVLRDQKFSWFADVDIAVPWAILDSKSSELISHFADYLHYTRYRNEVSGKCDINRNISQIVFMSSSNEAEIEPAILDIHALELIEDEARMYVGRSDFLTSDRVHFTGFRTVQLEGRTLCLPDRAETYVEQLYGEGWREPVERFYYASHRTRGSL